MSCASRDQAQSDEGDNGYGDVRADKQVRCEESDRAVIGVVGYAQLGREIEPQALRLQRDLAIGRPQVLGKCSVAHALDLRHRLAVEQLGDKPQALVRDFIAEVLSRRSLARTSA